MPRQSVYVYREKSSARARSISSHPYRREQTPSVARTTRRERIRSRTSSSRRGPRPASRQSRSSRSSRGSTGSDSVRKTAYGIANMALDLHNTLACNKIEDLKKQLKNALKDAKEAKEAAEKGATPSSGVCFCKNCLDTSLLEPSPVKEQGNESGLGLSFGEVTGTPADDNDEVFEEEKGEPSKRRNLSAHTFFKRVTLKRHFKDENTREKLKKKTEEFQDELIGELEDEEKIYNEDLEEVFVSDDEVIVLSDPESPENPEDRGRIVEDLVSTTDVSDSDDEVQKSKETIGEKSKNSAVLKAADSTSEEGPELYATTDEEEENLIPNARRNLFPTEARSSVHYAAPAHSTTAARPSVRNGASASSTTAATSPFRLRPSSVMLSNKSEVITLEEEDKSVAEELEELMSLVKALEEDLTGVTLPVIKDLSIKLNALEARNDGLDDDNNQMIDSLHDHLQMMVDEISAGSVSFVALGDGLAKQEEVSDFSDDEIEQDHGEDEDIEEDAIQAHKQEKQNAIGRQL